MAITLVRAFNGSDAFASSFSVTVPAAGVAAGDTLILSCASADSTFNVSSISDTGGNTYTVRSGTRTVIGGNTILIADAHISTALNSGDTITLTLAGATGGSALVSEFSGIAAASYFDVSHGATIAFDTAFDSGATATTAQADELVFGTMYAPSSARTFTAGSGFTEIAESAFFTAWVQQTEYKVVAATGTYSATATADSATEGIAVVATYKAASSGTNATVDLDTPNAVASATASSVAPPKPRPANPFVEVNLRM